MDKPLSEPLFPTFQCKQNVAFGSNGALPMKCHIKCPINMVFLTEACEGVLQKRKGWPHKCDVCIKKYLNLLFNTFWSNFPSFNSFQIFTTSQPTQPHVPSLVSHHSQDDSYQEYNLQHLSSLEYLLIFLKNIFACTKVFNFDNIQLFLFCCTYVSIKLRIHCQIECHKKLPYG